MANGVAMPTGVTIAGLGARALVAVLDGLPLALLGALVSVLMTRGVDGVPLLVTSIAVSVVSLAWVVFLWWGYATRGQSPAARLLRIRVLRLADGRPLGWGHYFLRELVWNATLVLPVIWLVLAIMMIVEPRRRGWHDMAGKSVVVRANRPTQPQPSAAPAQRATVASANMVGLPPRLSQGGFVPEAPMPEFRGDHGGGPISTLPSFASQPPSSGSAFAPPVAGAPAVPWDQWGAAPPAQAQPGYGQPPSAPATPSQPSYGAPAGPYAPQGQGGLGQGQAPQGQPGQGGFVPGQAPQGQGAFAPGQGQPVPGAFGPQGQSPQGPGQGAFASQAGQGAFSPQGQAGPGSFVPQGQAPQGQAAYPGQGAYPGQAGQQAAQPSYPSQAAPSPQPYGQEAPQSPYAPAGQSPDQARAVPAAQRPLDPSVQAGPVGAPAQAAYPSGQYAPVPQAQSAPSAAPAPASDPQPLRRPAPPVRAVAQDLEDDATRTHFGPPGLVPGPRRKVTEGWQLHLDDGQSIPVEGLVLIGRNPQPKDGEQARLVQAGVESRMVSKTHLAVGLDHRGLYVMDRGSTNGTAIANAGGQFEPCAPGDPVRVREGQIVSFGDRYLEIRRTHQ